MSEEESNNLGLQAKYAALYWYIVRVLTARLLVLVHCEGADCKVTGIGTL